jgi:hypothetical protein
MRSFSKIAFSAAGCASGIHACMACNHEWCVKNGPPNMCGEGDNQSECECQWKGNHCDYNANGSWFLGKNFRKNHPFHHQSQVIARAELAHASHVTRSGAPTSGHHSINAVGLLDLKFAVSIHDWWDWDRNAWEIEHSRMAQTIFVPESIDFLPFYNFGNANFCPPFFAICLGVQSAF